MIPAKNSLLLALLLVLLVGAPAASRADVVFLKSGGKLEGRIVQQTETSVEVDIGAGSLTLPMSSVDRIEKGHSQLDEFDERAAALDPYDRDGWLQLAHWASRAGLGTQSKRAYQHVLKIDPNDPEANQALGRVQVEGSWMTEDEAYRARGYVRFEGRWVTPAEQDSILRAREAERDAARAQAQAAEARARAEGQAREAEARAREAEARAEQPTRGTPLYWNTWGPGPSTWPTNPLDQGRIPERSGGQP
jgi:tetratricopeptide (TPR) repeat protein